MPAPTPRRAGRKAKPGARFMSDVLADNLRAYRLLNRMEQAEVAEMMTRLGHPWTQATVSQVERGRRNVTVDELLSLTLTLATTFQRLLDPTGPDGSATYKLDYGPGTLDTVMALAWVSGDFRLEVIQQEDDSWVVRRKDEGDEQS
jgi:transcriptional regulator with XRE-family HTH domain